MEINETVDDGDLWPIMGRSFGKGKNGSSLIINLLFAKDGEGNRVIHVDIQCVLIR